MRRAVITLNPLDAPHRCVELRYPRPGPNADPRQLVTNHHTCAPGLSRAVRAYIRAHPDVPAEKPASVHRVGVLYLDLGGMASAVAPFVRVGIGGKRPYYLGCYHDHLHAVVRMLENAQPKTYGRTATVRFGCWFPGGGTRVVVLRAEERDEAVARLRPLVDESLGAAIELRQRVAKSPHVHVAGYPLPEGEA